MSKLISKFWQLLGGGNTTIHDSKAIFFVCKTQAEKKLWYTRGRVNDDFKSRHTMILLHIWMVHRRLLLESKRGLKVQECLFDEFWEDSSNRIRGAGIPEMSVNKRLLEVQKYSWKYCVELDDTINRKKSLTDMEMLDNIGGSLWRSVYDRREDVDVDHVLGLARYVKDEQQAILHLPADAVFSGRIRWGAIPWGSSQQTQQQANPLNSDYLGSAKSTTSVADTNTSEIDDLSKPSDIPATNLEKLYWREAIASNGRTYYWHLKTRQTQWEKPSCLE